MEIALNTLRSFGKDSLRYAITVEDIESHWSVYLEPSNPNTRGGDMRIRITKDTLEVVEVRRYQ